MSFGFFLRLGSLLCGLSISVGSLRGALAVARHGYLDDGLSNLALLELRDVANRHLMLGLLALAVFGAGALVGRLLSTARVRERTVALVQRALDRRVYLWSALPALTAVLLLNGLTAGHYRNRPSNPLNVVLITIDTVRADRLSCYGNERMTTPNLDRLATTGVVFEQAYAQAPWTLPSMATIHSSLYPADHGAVRNDTGMSRRVSTLAEHFKNDGYTTIAVISHTFVDRAFGFDQGFDHFDRTHIRDHKGQSSKELSDSAIDYLRRHHEDPLFLWVHYFDPHYDYRSHAEFPYGSEYRGDLPETLTIGRLIDGADALSSEDLAYVRDVFDGEISYTDAHIGRLLDSLGELGIAGRTLVAVTADHGEEFLDHGQFGHGKRVYQELIRVPLILHHPSREELRGVRARSPVELRSIGRTLLDAAGIASPHFDGRDLFAVAGGEVPARDCFAEGSYAWGADGRRLALIRGRWKLIHNLDDEVRELYDLASDPMERRDLIEIETEIRDSMVPALEARLRAAGLREAEPARLDEAERERLQGLGYIN